MNKSIEDISKMLKCHDINNYGAMTRLINPKLRCFDDDDNMIIDSFQCVTDDIKKECKENPWFFFRNIIRIHPITRLSIEPNQKVTFNIITATMIHCYINGISFLVTQPRQCYTSGMSQLMLIYDKLYRLNKIGLFLDDYEFKNIDENMQSIINANKSSDKMFIGISTVNDELKKEYVDFINGMKPFRLEYFDGFPEDVKSVHIQYPVEMIHSTVNIEYLKQTLGRKQEFIDREIYMKRG